MNSSHGAGLSEEEMTAEDKSDVEAFVAKRGYRLVKVEALPVLDRIRQQNRLSQSHAPQVQQAQIAAGSRLVPGGHVNPQG